MWRYGYGPTLSRDPERTALIDYVRGPGTTRVALVSEPSGAIVREGWLQTVSWWTGRPLERLLQDPADWPALAAYERVDPDRAGNAASGDKPRSSRSGWRRSTRAGPSERRATPRRLLEVAAAGRRVGAWPNVLFRHVDWNIGIVPVPIDRMLTDGDDAPVAWLPTRPGRFAADPFGIERDGVLHILFEDYDQRTSRGAISHIAIDPDGSMSDPEPVLDPGVHASYPFLIEDAGGIFMLPEVSAAGELVLYEAVEFPRRWRPAATLLPGVPAADATVVEYEGRWWMFATRADRGANQNLFIWHAAELTGPWLPHAANPVKTDARSARPGGTPFIAGGVLYRPGQDNSRRYGGRIIVNRVDVLTPTAFSERPVKAIGPRRDSPYPDGLHTLSSVGGRTLIDGNGLHFVREVFRNNVASKIPGLRSS